MSDYATLKDLIERADGDEIVRRGMPLLRLRYRQAVPLAADIETTVSDPQFDDVVLAEDDGLLYRYAMDSWKPFVTAKIDRVLEDACAVADDYMRGRYELPLTATPRSLVLAVCDIARFNLYDDGVTETVQVRYDHAMKYLEKIAKGTIALDSAEAVPQEDGPGSANITGPGRVMGRDQMKDLL